jgi:cytochrome c oxidase assembly protein subunit 15
MSSQILQRNQRQVSRWLLAGVCMLVIQVLLGGITRLTESGLSITEWNPITGTLPPLSDSAWQAEFAKYRQTDQFRFVHQSFSLSDFKFIYFWEWFHRLWARLMSMVFLVGFFYFLLRRKLTKEAVMPMIILFLLGALQAAIGWIMVKSGLVPQMYFVGHVELATHFLAANILLAYTLWFALDLLPSYRAKVYSGSLRSILWVLLLLIAVQFMYGALMAGLKAGSAAPTWPDINGAFIPAFLNEKPTLIDNLFNNKIMVQFLHRGGAYIIFLLVHIFYFLSASFTSHKVFARLRKGLLAIVWIQLLLGIATVIHAADPAALVWWGVAHQLTGILLLICIISVFHLVRRPTTA